MFFLKKIFSKHSIRKISLHITATFLFSIFMFLFITEPLSAEPLSEKRKPFQIAYKNQSDERRERYERAARIGQELGERMRKEGRKLTREQMYEELIKEYPEFEIKELINQDGSIAEAGLQTYNREKYEEVMKRKKMKEKSSNR